MNNKNIYFKFKRYLWMIKLTFLFLYCSILLLLLYNSYYKILYVYQFTKNKIEKFYKFCNNGILLNKKKFKNNDNPKISIITPIYNKEKYILRYLRSIQNQFFDDIEIILVDDNSEDKTIKLIEEYKIVDERIILIKNKKNKGTLISRNEGVFKSKGRYLIFLDPDDLLSYNILNNIYNIVHKYDYDIIRFNMYEGKGKINLESIVINIIDKKIFQPELSSYLFYGLGKIEELDYYITNKLIKREIFIKSLNLINQYFLNQYMIDCEDGLINFMLYRTAKSYYFIKNIGYYYFINEQSITKENEGFKKRVKSNFLYLKFIFENTKNKIIEKNIANYIFLEIYSHHKDFLLNLFQEINGIEIEFYKEVINLYLKCKFISFEAKQILNQILFVYKNNKKS